MNLRFRIMALPALGLEGVLAGLVSEAVGGIYAYFTDHALAERVADKLNEGETATDEPTHWVDCQMFDENVKDFMTSLTDGDLSAIMDGQRIVGFALTENEATPGLTAALAAIA